ncbi:hypothetical protein [Lewinella sp. IMCC34183]|uniref:hypothetical protein n=1 Tax=Lewinella sp. IMCC34183 TaxID=2248762 RepID=UPI000E261A0A|nr:hypothetical protein [Lewinella sp. IMCC34183]
MKAIIPMLTLLLLGCGGPDNTTAGEPATVPAPRTPPEGSAPPAAVAFTTGDLRGTWKRTDYPYGTLEFRDEEVKINVGEGMAAPPAFQPYRLADECPAGGARTLAGTEQRYLVYGSDVCEVLTLGNDTLRQSDVGESYVITYVKQ